MVMAGRWKTVIHLRPSADDIISCSTGYSGLAALRPPKNRAANLTPPTPYTSPLSFFLSASALKKSPVLLAKAIEKNPV